MSRFILPRQSLLALLIFCFPAPLHAQVSQRLSLSKPLINRWSYETPSASIFTPAVEDDLVFVPLVNGELVALSKTTGALSWRAEIGGDFSASPVSDEARVYIASEIRSKSTGDQPSANGIIHCLAAKSGLTIWARRISGSIQQALTEGAGLLFGGTADGKFYAFKKATGEILWIKSNPSAFTSQATLSGEKLYVGDEGGTLHVIEVATGRTLWRFRTRGALRAAPAVINGAVYIGSTDAYALSEKTGKLRWRARTGTAIQSLVATPKCVVTTSLDNFVYCLSPKDGKKVWKRQVAGRILSKPLAADDGVLVAPLSGDECIVLGLHDGKKINSINVGEENNTAAGPVEAGGFLLITTRKGLLALSGEADATSLRLP